MTISPYAQVIKNWLESQLETATEQGGNEIMPGTYVEEIQVDAGEENEIIVLMTDGFTVSFHITQWGQ